MLVIGTFQVALVIKNPPAKAGDVRDSEFDPWVRKIPLEEGMAIHSSILAWRIPMNRRAWWATVCRVIKKSDMTEAAWHACSWFMQ